MAKSTDFPELRKSVLVENTNGLQRRFGQLRRIRFSDLADEWIWRTDMRNC